MRTFTLIAWNLLRTCWHFTKLPLQAFTVFLRTVWLLFSAFFFTFCVYTCFWSLSQGKDVLISMLEKKWVGGIVILSLVFWVLVTWYSSRILIYRKKQLYSEGQLNEKIAFHSPRVLSFLGFSIIWIALLRLPKLEYLNFMFRLNPGMDMFWLAASMAAYIFLYRLFKKFRERTLAVVSTSNSQYDLDRKEAWEKKKFRYIYIMTGCITISVLALNTLISNAWLLIASIILMQVTFLFIVVTRRGRMTVDGNSNNRLSKMPRDYNTIQEWQQAEKENGNVFTISIWERILYNANIPLKEKPFFIIYNCISFVSLFFYFITITNYHFSVKLGSLATVLLSFGVLVGFFSMVSFISVALKINLHVIGFILVLVIGKFFEPHNAALVSSANPQVQAFAQRPGLHQYFHSWAAQRKTEIEKGGYPVFFVLADGGASRSGYWTAATLSKLEDTTGGKFSQHLFCLSGASGGSVGNGTFFALLRYKDSLQRCRKTFTKGSSEFLQSDFLTYTLARMLGPDFIRPLIGSLPIADRADALEHAIEQGEDDNAFLHNVFKSPMSAMIPTGSNSNLPILCVNVTRMQDGRPSVISNIKADENIFSRRVDILARLPVGKDMKLSTAVVMGARFPYISPAGRIDSSYYVDGGYFDNSGAGFVHEMLMELNRIIADTLQKNPNHYFKNLKFYVLHSQNGGNGDKLLKKIHPVWNDLGSPLLTMVGGFTTQTSVNDLRLKTYMQDMYRKTGETGYFRINLYTNKKNEEEYPMNWAISKYYINKMDALLADPKNDLAYFYNYMKRKGVF
jgi:predicted acylesterase/phospholipase RssA